MTEKDGALRKLRILPEKGRPKKEAMQMHRMKINTFAKLALVLFTALCIITVVKLKMEFNTLEDTKRSLEERGSPQLSAATRNSKTSLKLLFDDEYVAEIAKKKLNLVMPDEVIFYNDLTD